LIGQLVDRQSIGFSVYQKTADSIYIFMVKLCETKSFGGQNHIALQAGISFGLPLDTLPPGTS
jgi:hypothetical protein